MQVDAGLDTGPVLACEKVAIGPRMTVSDLHDDLARIGAPLMVRAVHAFAAGRITPQPQPADAVTYAAKLDRHQGPLAWTQPATRIPRALPPPKPAPATFFDLNAATLKQTT